VCSLYTFAQLVPFYYTTHLLQRQNTGFMTFQDCFKEKSDVASLFYCKGIAQHKCVPVGVTKKRRYKAVLTYLLEAA
jgi:hypothetical protein